MGVGEEGQKDERGRRGKPNLAIPLKVVGPGVVRQLAAASHVQCGGPQESLELIFELGELLRCS